MSPIARLKGIVAECGPDWLIVDVNGVGYLVYSPRTPPTPWPSPSATA